MLALVGWLAADLGLRGWEPTLEADRRLEAARGPLPDALPGSPPRTDPPALDGMSPRELRLVPGVGEGRALAFARARWRRGRGAEPLRPSEVPGVGEVTERRVREWLRAREGQMERPGAVPYTAGPEDRRERAFE